MARQSKIIAGIVFVFLPLIALAAGSNGRIEFWVSPIRHELKINPGQSLSEEVKFINSSDVPYNLFLTIEDCTPDSNYGTPKCSKAPGSGSDPTKLSNWISIPGVQSYTVPPKGEWVVPFTVNAPANASPGWYYGAIFFNNPGTNDTSSGANVGLIRRIGVLVLTEVSWNIVIQPVIGPITVGWGGAGGASAPWNTLLQNLLKNPLDTKNLQDLWNFVVGELDPFLNAPTQPPKPKDGFSVDFQVPISNSWNTHFKPSGKITIIDEDGNQMLKIGKETIKSPEWAFIGERIVDYIPINDELGNILPGTERNFLVQWLGFPYQTIGADGTVVIEYKTPDEYFSSMNSLWALYPWERIRTVERNRELKAHIEISYVDKEGKVQTSSYDKPVFVHYFEQVKWLHYGRILIFLILAWFVWILVSRRRDRRIADLEARLLEDEEKIEKNTRRKNATSKSSESVDTPVAVGTRTKKVLRAKEVEETPPPPRKRRKPPTE